MPVTMKEIADAAGVSKTTVSKIINGTDNHISEETKRRIRKLIEETGYVPNSVARNLRSQRTGMIGFILPDITNPFFPMMARGIEDKAKMLGYGVVMCNTDDNAESELQQLNFLTSKMIDGIIFIRSLRESSMKRALQSKVPIVIADRDIKVASDGIGQVFVDTVGGIQLATNVLLNSGCRRIGFISAQQDIEENRFDGYRRALAKAQISFDEGWVYTDRYNVETGREGIKSIFRHGGADGIVCGNDLIAFGAIQELKDEGYQIPEEVKVIGFDNIYFSQYTEPPLTTIEQPAYEIGQCAAEMLIENILHGVPLGRKILNYRLVSRKSV